MVLFVNLFRNHLQKIWLAILLFKNLLYYGQYRINESAQEQFEYPDQPFITLSVLIKQEYSNYLESHKSV